MLSQDCFYAQVERERFPHWSGSPIAVVQNGTLVVTSNYRVRARGYPKMGAPEGMLACPGIRYGGSNMVRYRAASKAWNAVFQSFPGVTVMKKSIDESYLDLTEACFNRLKEGGLRRVVKQSAEEAQLIREAAQQRHAVATAAWQEEDRLMRAQGVAECDLESTGALKAAQLFSRSTDPITELRRQAQAAAPERGLPPTFPNRSERDEAAHSSAAPNGTNSKAANAAQLSLLSKEEVDALCNKMHPLDHCRADKRQPAVMLQPMDAAVAPEQRLPGVECAPWRELYCGFVFLDGTAETKQPTSAAPAAPATAASSSSAAAVAPAASSAEAEDDVVIPPSFACEDLSNPSHDLLMAVGSQICFEMRSRLFETLGFTTSAGVAPNCMLAKLCSSLNKPNQQSVCRASIAEAFLRPIKLAAISGFGPKAEEQAEERGLVYVGDVQKLSLAALTKLFPSAGGDKFANYLCEIARGIDDTPVLVHAAPKSIGQSKRQKTQTHEQRFALLGWLCQKLMDRVIEDEKEFMRRATVLTFSWITAGDWTSISRRTALPPYKEHRTDGLPVHTEMLEASIRMCKQHLSPTASLRCLAVSVSQFVPLQGGKGIEGYFASAPASAAAGVEAQSVFSQAMSTQPPSRSAAAASTPLAGFFGCAASAARSASSHSPAKPAAVLPPAASSSLLSPTRSAPVSAAAASSLESDLMPLLEVAPSALAGSLLAGMSARSRDASEKMTAHNLAEESMAATAEDTAMAAQDQDEIELLFGGSQPNKSGAADAAPAPSAASSASPAASAATSSAADALQLCPDCGQSIPSRLMVEHSDHHFAVQFQAQIREADRKQREAAQLAQAQAAAAVQASGGSGSKRKKASASSAAASGGGLDRFMVALPAASDSAAAAAASPHKAASSCAQSKSRSSASAASTPTLKSFFSTR